MIDRVEAQDTPNDGSWLNMAQTELAVFTTACLDRRIPDKVTSPRDARPKRRTVHDRLALRDP